MSGITTRPLKSFLTGLAMLGLAAFGVEAAEISVMSSGGFTQALKELAPVFEKKTGHHVTVILGPSMGTSDEAIPTRVARGENADLVIMVGYALGDLVKKGVVKPESRIDLVESKIAMAVKAGQPKPDISTLDAFKTALKSAKSVAYSDSASGVYIEKEMYAKLGIETELKPKSRMIIAERVGNIVARGEAEIGFQQVSELLPIKGIEIVGVIPEGAQKVTVFSAGVPAAAKEPALGRALLEFLDSAEGRAVSKATGLDPIAKAP